MERIENIDYCIRYLMAQKFPHTTLVRFNRDHPDPYLQDLPRFIAFTEINECLNVL